MYTLYIFLDRFKTDLKSILIDPKPFLYVHAHNHRKTFYTICIVF